ncbi:MAG: hypothetical protein WCC04_20830 [Terriglobales bacterium]
MMTSRTRSLLVHLLPFLHLCACLIIALGSLESGWQYLTMIDAPASILVIALIYNFNHPLILFGIVGTLWWYLLSRGVEFCWVRFSTAIRSRKAAGNPAKQ